MLFPFVYLIRAYYHVPLHTCHSMLMSFPSALRKQTYALSPSSARDTFFVRVVRRNMTYDSNRSQDIHEEIFLLLFTRAGQKRVRICFCVWFNESFSLDGLSSVYFILLLYIKNRIKEKNINKKFKG